jgi:hypothetical protein
MTDVSWRFTLSVRILLVKESVQFTELYVQHTFGHADLLRHFDNLDLDVDLNERFRERVDLDETWVDGASETTELGDETNISLLDRLVWVWAAETARNGTESTDGRAESVDHATIPASARSIFGVGLDDLRIRWLEILTAWRLDVDDGIVGTSDRWRRVAVRGPLDRVAVGLGKAHCGDGVCLFVCCDNLAIVVGMIVVDD